MRVDLDANRHTTVTCQSCGATFPVELWRDSVTPMGENDPVDGHNVELRQEPLPTQCRVCAPVEP